MSDEISRRALLHGTMFAAAASAVSIVSPARARQPASLIQRNALRIAHLTDMHVKPERHAPEGYAAALQSLQKLDPQPAFLITGGDHIMDALESTRERAIVQWDLFRKTQRENTKLRTYPVLGNHDVWGWSSKTPIDESIAGYGKAMAMEQLELTKTYYSLDQGAWHIVVLDNIARRPDKGGYLGNMDDEQIEWLRGDLASATTAKKHIAVFSHIPLVSICALFFNEKPKEFWRMGDNLMQRDVRPILKLLQSHNVKLCVSGHIHLLDRIQFMGLNFVCDGAVSGSWWGGPFQDVPEGYGVFDLYDDGTFEHQYVAYGWKAG